MRKLMWGSLALATLMAPGLATAEDGAVYAGAQITQYDLHVDGEDRLNPDRGGALDRLTGQHETAHYSQFRYGVSDRGASIRIPWQVAQDQKGYIEDRRPNANCDPYVVARLITETVCSAAS